LTDPDVLEEGQWHFVAFSVDTEKRTGVIVHNQRVSAIFITSK
jgi:hypothetical protein